MLPTLWESHTGALAPGSSETIRLRALENETAAHRLADAHPTASSSSDLCPLSLSENSCRSLTDQAAPAPVGWLVVAIQLLSPTAAQKPLAVHATSLSARPGLTGVVCHLASVLVGRVVLNALPASSSATHRLLDAHDTSSTWAAGAGPVPGTDANDHAELAAAPATADVSASAAMAARTTAATTPPRRGFEMTDLWCWMNVGIGAGS